MTKLEAITYRKSFDQIYFKTYGSRTSGDYEITLHYPNGDYISLPSIKGNTQNGLEEARIIICKYIIDNMNGTHDTIFNHYCVSPDRSPNSKDQWNQFEVSQFIQP
ncbi:hypothetical protein [Gracilibacillus xinjiangensis]|uniref:Uncharacterized protein n=1 Tax=Gracilibacillus xinjiangensis TaxID=1193282 RepID=A0ABV8WU99_9BACI